MDKPRLDQGPDYERGFIDGMMHLTQSSVYKAVDAMSKRPWVDLTNKEIGEIYRAGWANNMDYAEAIQKALKEKNDRPL
jgi:hypothetical protein